MPIEYDYLVNLQEAYKKYKQLEETLWTYLDKHMGGSIRSVAIVDGIVIVNVDEKCRGCDYNETYEIPLGYFQDDEMFVNNLMKFRN